MATQRMPTFEDRSPTYDYGSGYKYTNEEPDLMITILGDRTFKRGGGICSAGEVPLFVMLPRCDEVVVIDMSYASLAAAWLKCAILSELGPKPARDLWLKADPKDVEDAIRSAAKTFPKPLIGKSGWWDGRANSTSATRFSTADFHHLKREAHYTPLEAYEEAYERLDKLTILHGDLKQDLAHYGKFDFLYTSNAIAYGGKPGYPVNHADVASLVNVGGLLLTTGVLNTTTDLPYWKIQSSQAPFRTSWTYTLCERLRKLTPPTVEQVEKLLKDWGASKHGKPYADELAKLVGMEEAA